MDILGANGIAIQFVNEEVFIRIYPNTDILVNISRESALHLYKLIKKYNYTIGTTKWPPIWKKLYRVERALIYMFLNQNMLKGKQIFSFKNPENLPKDFTEIKEESRLSKISPSVFIEFEALFKIYTKATVTKEEVAEKWKEWCPEVYKIIEKYNQLEYLLKNYCEEEIIYLKIDELVRKEGKDAFEKPSWSDDYNDNVFDFVVKNYSSLFSGMASHLTKV